MYVMIKLINFCKKIFLPNKWLFLIIFLALTIRLIYFINIKPWNEYYFIQKLDKGDAGEYQLLAETIVKTGKYPENIYLDTYRGPIFPLYISFIYLVFGIKHYLVLASQILLNIISIIFIYLICEKIFNKKLISLIAASFYSFEPNVIMLTMEYGTETLHATLLIISVYYLIMGIKFNKKNYLAISGLFFGITALTRPISLYFYILCIIFIFLFTIGNLSDKFKYATFFIAFYFIALFPWMYRNYKVYNHFSSNTFQGNAVLYYAGLTKHHLTGISTDMIFIDYLNSLDSIRKEKNMINPFEIDEQKQIIGFDYLKNNIISYIPLHIKGIFRYFIAPLFNNKYTFIFRIIFGFYFFVIYSLAIFGIWKMFKNKQYFFVLFFISIMFYFSFLTGIIGRARYRLPVTAFYLIFAAAGAYFIINRLFDRKIDYEK